MQATDDSSLMHTTPRLGAHETRSMRSKAIICLLLGYGATAVLAFMEHDNGRHFFHAYLWALSFYLTLGFGALFFVALQHLTRAGWSVVVRRLAEMICNTLPYTAMLFAPVLIAMICGNSTLYEWVNTHEVAQDPLLLIKSPYLNVPFFVGRYLAYCIIWTALTWFFLSESVQQDRNGALVHSARMQFVSAPAMILFALTLTFAAIDLIMSLTPHWYSTMFGVYVFAGSMVAFLAYLIVLVRVLHWRGHLREEITTEHYHDLGKLLFGFVFFWGYIAFSQFMLMWYANLPEETSWYLVRQQGGWEIISITLLVGHLLLPFPGLLSRHVKRNRNFLSFWAVWLLVMHAIDLYWLIMPNYSPSPVFGLMELCCLVAIAGVYNLTLATLTHHHPLVPLHDPRLSESLHFENI